MIRKVVFILVSFIFSVSFAQEREASYWYFGYFSGLHFNTDPVGVIDGKMNIEEGTSVATDEDGNLLFYTNGVNVWSARTYPHTLMSNGTDLLGGSNSTQSALIIPNPENKNIFYIFTVSDLLRVNKVLTVGNGLNYSIVDMSLNGGAGAVTRKNVHLITYNEDKRDEDDLKCSQKLTAVAHADDTSYWVVTHFLDRFFSFHITNRGVSTRPVVSEIGPTLFSGNYLINAKGQLKLSPDGTYLAMANMANGFDSEGEGTGNLYLFNFDDTTGEVTNSQKLLPNDFVYPYGVAFSDDSKKLYVTMRSFRDGTIDRGKSSLFQFDLTSSNIPASGYSLYKNDKQNAGALQLAIDNKVYGAANNKSKLLVVNKPRELRGNSDFSEEGANLLGRPSKRGLPSFIQSYFHVEIKKENTCAGRETAIAINYLPEPVTIDWDFGDGTLLLNSTNKNPKHIYTSAGNYRVTATVDHNGSISTYTSTVTIYPLPNLNTVRLTQCDDDGDGFSEFNLKEASAQIALDTSLRYSYHLTQADADTNANPINGAVAFSNRTASRIYVRALNENGCYQTTTIDLVVVNTAIPSNFNIDFYSCDDLSDGDDANGITNFDFSDATIQIRALFPSTPGLVVKYYENRRDALAELNELNPQSYKNTSPFTKRIWVRVETTAGNSCFGLGEHLTLYVNPTPVFEVNNPEILCKNQPTSIALQVQNTTDNYSYSWTDFNGNILPATSKRIFVNEEGTYTVTVAKTDGTGCTKTANFVVEASDIAIINDVAIVDNSSNNTITINVKGIGIYEYALDDQGFVSGNQDDGHQFKGVSLGEHTIYIKDINGCGMVSREVSLIGFPRFFTPNGDSVNDTWQLTGVRLQPGSEIRIYDRFGTFITALDPTGSGWDGTFNGKLLPSSDYWFFAHLDDGRIYKGHFALKR
ncbi:T9SS type B sorting domain-containing protein [Ascidiimonas sp. W6]|uniref:T9SS type B sorting domain-containing protein n=1 Tax=Ascidiimonas meishanensis TaxID=3128903 RepID=UPI0030EF192D